MILQVKELINPLLSSLLDDKYIPDLLLITVGSTYIEGLHFAAQCLYLMRQFEDCIALLEPLLFLEDNDSMTDLVVKRVHSFFDQLHTADICQMSGLYCLVGKCFDVLDNRWKSLRALTISVRLDLGCIEAAEYLIQGGLMTDTQRIALFDKIKDDSSPRAWLLPHYRQLLLSHEDQLTCTVASGELEIAFCIPPQSRETPIDLVDKPSSWLVRNAEISYNQGRNNDCYRFARQAYAADPYDPRGLKIYIAALVALNQQSELYHLAHELVSSFPKMALSWYAVGCYYWCCLKLDSAQLFLQKAVKLDKREAPIWIMMGHVLSALEESEHAISAYRTAVRLLPGSSKPALFMARELLRTNYVALALQILLACSKTCPDDPLLLNEIGVCQLRLGSLVLSRQRLEKAVAACVQVLLPNSLDVSRRLEHVDCFLSEFEVS